jgi:hypothetical protein
MMNSYDRNRAHQLVPLLKSITKEMEERVAAIRRLEAQVETISAGGRDKGNVELDLQAELATQRRELRLAGKELERLGCIVDPTHPQRVLIPGSDGNIERGFRWDLDATGIYRLPDTTRS